MIKKLIFSIGLIVSFDALSQTIVDVYGVDDNKSHSIVEKYSKEVGKIESSAMALIMNSSSMNNTDIEVEKKLSVIKEKKNALIKKIKNEGGFLFVDFDTVIYPKDQTLNTTIEVIDKTQPSRLRYISPPLSKSNKPVPHDLINQMIIFNKIEMQLMLNNQLDLKHPLCPVYHCFSGFQHPKLKPYLNVFNLGVIKDKKLIIDTLNHDADPTRRAAATFLIGHFQDPKEIITLLEPHINDSNDSVRNNVMRVISATIRKAKLTELNVEPLIDLLDSPYDTDRNKALHVILNSIKTDHTKKIIIQKGGKKLLALLKLKQLNNHEPAYLILKRISGKKYGEYDINAWEKWIAQAKNSSPKISG